MCVCVVLCRAICFAEVCWLGIAMCFEFCRASCCELCSLLCRAVCFVFAGVMCVEFVEKACVLTFAELPVSLVVRSCVCCKAV